MGGNLHDIEPPDKCSKPLLPAAPHRATSGAKIAAVFADHGVVAAFVAQFTGCRFGGGAAVGGFEDAHLLPRQAGFVE